MRLTITVTNDNGKKLIIHDSSRSSVANDTVMNR